MFAVDTLGDRLQRPEGARRGAGTGCGSSVPWGTTCCAQRAPAVARVIGHSPWGPRADRKQIMRTRPAPRFLLLVCLACSIPGLGQPAGERQAEPNNRVLRADPRLKGVVRLTPSASEIGVPGEAAGEGQQVWTTTLELIAARGLQPVRASFALQPSLWREPITLTSRELDVPEFMEALALAVGATWRSVQGAWVLTDIPNAAHLIPLGRIGILARDTSGSRLSAFMTPAQWEMLQRGLTVRAADLTPLQRYAFSVRAMEIYLSSLDGRAAVARDAFLGQGVKMHLSPAIPGGVNAEVMHSFRRADGDPIYEHRSSRPVENVGILGPAFRFDPRLLGDRVSLPLPEATTKAPARTAEEQLAYDADPRLEHSLPVGREARLPLARVLGAVAAAANLDLVAGTAMHRRVLTLPTGNLSAREALNVVELRTGGRWRPLGKGYVLQPHPRAEMAAHSRGRERQLPQALAAFPENLTPKSRKTLERTGTLPLSLLTEPERDALIRLAAGGFVWRADVDQRALNLEGVSVRSLAAEPSRQLPRRLEITLPGLPGAAPVLLTTPWAPAGVAKP